MQTIGICGPIGSYDLGDWALLQSNIEFFKRDFKFILFTYDIEKTKTIIKILNLERYIEEIVDISLPLFPNITPFSSEIATLVNYLLLNSPRYNRKKLIEISMHLNNVDKLLVIGGAYLNKVWGINYLPIITTMKISKKLQKPIIIRGINIGPLSNVDMLILRSILPKCDSLSLRSKYHQEIMDLKKLEIITYDSMGDDATFLESRYKTGLDLSRYIVLNLHPIGLFSKKTIFEIMKFLTIITKEGYDAVFLPMHFDKNSDYSTGIKIKKLLKDEGVANFYILDPHEWYNPKNIKYLIRNASFVISSRLHPIIFAIGEKTPFIGILLSNRYLKEVYTRKIIGSLQVFNLDPTVHVIEEKDVSWRHLLNLFLSNLDQTDYDNRAYKINYKKINKLNHFIREV